MWPYLQILISFVGVAIIVGSMMIVDAIFRSEDEGPK